jgi:hypothetical protein
MKKMGYIPVLLFFTQILLAGNGDPVDKKQYITRHLNSAALHFDGVTDEPAWDAVPWESDFVQMQPNEGAKPSQQTSFKILYDDKFLYLAYRAHDTAPDSIIQRMVRRDEFPGGHLALPRTGTE